MEYETISVGLVSASVCTSLAPEKAAERLNDDWPTGIPHRWHLAEDTHFNSGEVNGCDCPDHAGNKHYLMRC